ncbi:MAG: S8 family serine peptidase, partial [Rhodospirillales bacterium]|nr:S8 family serine peptidase [Rhodospirillales bacterium]
MTSCRFIVALAVALTVPPLAGAQAQWETTYRQRFMEEAQRKIPPLVVAPPGAAERAAARAPASQGIDLNEARAIMGLSQPVLAARLPGGKLAIIDGGFRGIRERLEAFPHEKALTTVMRPGASPVDKPVPDTAYAGPWEEDHGYWVYRVVRAVAPDVHVLLYTVDDLDWVAGALLHAGTQGVVLSNVSLSFPSHFQIFSQEEDAVSKYLRVYLPQQEAFAFISSGNQRQNVHSFVSADRNNNGYVDLHDTAAHGRDLDSLRLKLRAGKFRTVLTWDASAHPDADYELQAVGAGNVVYYSARVGPTDKVKGRIILRHAYSQPADAALRVKRLAGPAGGVFMRINAYPIGVSADFNGLQTTNAYLFRENPFVTFVGSFGKAAGGRFAPSPFSNVGTAPDGRLTPHVLGPGQLLIDGKPTNGTSFSSPFITAMYATQVGYNFKNLIARSSNFTRFAPGVAPHERSRWGIPDPALLAKLDDLVGPTRIEEVSHRIDDGNLVVKFAVTRCCMESLSWGIAVDLVDPADGKTLGGALAVVRSDKADFVRHPLEVRFPLKSLEAFKGKTAKLRFDIKARRWANPPPGTLKIHQAAAYDIVL